MSTSPENALDQELRVRDPDRWLATRYVGDPGDRARLVALYSLDGEWARAAALAHTPLAGEIRLSWWREAVERFAQHGPAEHPALEALGREVTARLQPDLQVVIAARIDALDDPSQADVAEAAIRATAIRLLDPNSPLNRLTAKAFPAVAHLALKAGDSELAKRLRITWAVLRGRL